MYILIINGFAAVVLSMTLTAIKQMRMRAWQFIKFIEGRKYYLRPLITSNINFQLRIIEYVMAL